MKVSTFLEAWIVKQSLKSEIDFRGEKSAADVHGFFQYANMTTSTNTKHMIFLKTISLIYVNKCLKWNALVAYRSIYKFNKTTLLSSIARSCAHTHCPSLRFLLSILMKWYGCFWLNLMSACNVFVIIYSTRIESSCAYQPMEN